MWREFLSSMPAFLSFFFAGISIKLLDDYIDENKPEFMPYIMVFLCLSISLYRNSASLFLSAYITGMFHDIDLKLISSLKAYQEQLVFFILSIVICGFVVTVSSLLVISAIQLLDDLIDQKDDEYTGKKNWAIILGRVEASIFFMLIVLLSFYLDWYKTSVCIILALSVSLFFNHLKRNRSFKEKL